MGFPYNYFGHQVSSMSLCATCIAAWTTLPAGGLQCMLFVLVGFCCFGVLGFGEGLGVRPFSEVLHPVKARSV